MNRYVERLSPEQWDLFSKNAHKFSFNLDRPENMNRISFALLVHDDRAPCCYMTIIELDKKSVYLQHGGSFPGAVEGGLNQAPAKGYYMIIDYLSENYEFASTKVLNTNQKMLKLHFSAGFIVTGTDTRDGETFLILSKNMVQNAA